MPYQPRHDRHRVGLDNLLLVVRAVTLRHHPGIAGLVVFLGGETDREGFDPAAAGARHHRYHGRGIDAARQEGAERHIRDQANTHRLFEMRHEFGAQFVQRPRSRDARRARQSPVAHQLRLVDTAVGGC